MVGAGERSPAAFVASWAFIISELPRRFPKTQEAITCILAPYSSPKSLSNHLETSRNSLALDQSMREMASNPRKIQHQISAKMSKLKSQMIIDDTSSDRDAARLLSLQGTGAGAWIEAVPTSSKFAMNPTEFRLAAFLRLGIPMPFSSCLVKCDCNATLDNEGYHLMTCKLGGGPVFTHERLKSEWSECLRELQLHHKKEPQHQYCDNEKRPDIVVFDSNSGCNIELDVSLVHPWRCDYLKKTASDPGYAAKKREEQKDEKYQHELHLTTSTSSFVPLVMEHFGRWGVKAEAYLKELSKRSRNEEGLPNPAEFKAVWRKRLSLQLQRCNANVIMKKIKRISWEGDEDENDYERDIHNFLH